MKSREATAARVSDVVRNLSTVMAGPGPAIHDFAGAMRKSWMPGPSPGMTC
jgi:hypothetical protein